MGDRIYGGAIIVVAAALPLMCGLLLISVGWAAWPALRTFGFSFLTTSDWNPVAGQFGIAPAIYGTLMSSLIALALATPLAFGVAIFLVELAPKSLRGPVAFAVDLLAAVPSVIYGLWGVFVLAPILTAYVMPFLADTLHLSVIPLFAGPMYPRNTFAAGVILAIMILPFISAIAREVVLAVPRSQREAALALGATRWEMIRHAVLPYAGSGLIGAVILGLGRALGETMAVTMLIGNRHEIAASLFAPGYTMASLLANEFSEATGDLHVAALMATGFVLLVLTIGVNALARWLVWQTANRGASR